MKQRVNKVASSFFFQLRRLKQVCRLLGSEVTTAITAFIISRLDYCNSSPAGLPKSTTASLQRVQNLAARLVTGTRMHDHVTPALQQLTMNTGSSTSCPFSCIWCTLDAYISTQVAAISNLASRRSLCSACSQRYEVPQTALKFGERAFSFAWNLTFFLST
jgi:hypothetical protein